jgi:riboflavin kinase/FMN adenylyltransferase
LNSLPPAFLSTLHERQFQDLKVYHHVEEFTPLSNAVVTTGTFDGVHIGHRKILSRLTDVAGQTGGESVLFTFSPHPRSVLQPDTDIRLLTTMDEKLRLLEQVGLDHVIVHPFTKEFSRTGSLEFVRELLVNQIGTKRLVIGYDHHFGRNREGSFEHLKEFGPMYGFDVEEIPAFDIDHVNVSSTKIRKALKSGDLQTAKQYLNHDYSLRGTVIEGNKLGRQIGFPTANMDIRNHEKLIPAKGVYAVRIQVGSVLYAGMLNIGNKPTVNGAGETNLEVNIFDFNEDIYNREIRVTFIKRLRDEQKFVSIDALKDQLDLDRMQAKKILSL